MSIAAVAVRDYRSYDFPSLPTSARISRELSILLTSDWDACQNEYADWLDAPTTLGELLAAVWADPDSVLCELVAACQRGFVQAGRVIVQALLPKMMVQGRSFPYPSLELLLAAMWIRIAQYPLMRRPRSVAANLTMDAKKDVLAESRIVQLTQVRVVESGPTARSVLHTARLLGLASPESLDIVELVYLQGWSPREVASTLSMTPDAVRRRCSDTIRRLRRNRDLLLD
ncbi:MAG: hypothetical protein LBV06_00070 [Propionibacteriaceae bacterium]|jgi:hypothetical protein|nr:hypothetical protein [Propionibacteriaceae bacterium]